VQVGYDLAVVFDAGDDLSVKGFDSAFDMFLVAFIISSSSLG